MRVLMVVCFHFVMQDIDLMRRHVENEIRETFPPTFEEDQGFVDPAAEGEWNHCLQI